MSGDTGADHPGDDLLTIREAAALLNVSAVSLRRWTDAGDLPCLRVGGRRERRFRRHDLLAFADDQPAGRNVEQNGAAVRPAVALEGVLIDYGSHLCSMYETDLGRIKLSVPFLAEGLERGDTCFLIAGPAVSVEITSALTNISVDVAATQEHGKLILSSGAPSGDEMYAFLESHFVAATQNGDGGLRVVGDMGWFLEFKALGAVYRFDQYLAHAYPVISLCQYDARRFSGVGMLTALRTHQDTFNLPLSRFLAS